MSLTVFLAICILGCDALIYFLYEWAFGESERIRKRHPRSRSEAPSPEVSADCEPRPNVSRAGASVVQMKHRKPAAATVIEMPRKSATPTNFDAQERLAYHRIAASYAPAKRRA